MDFFYFNYKITLIIKTSVFLLIYKILMKKVLRIVALDKNMNVIFTFLQNNMETEMLF